MPSSDATIHHRAFERSVSVASDSSLDWDTSMQLPQTPRNSVAFPGGVSASQSDNSTPSHSRGPSSSHNLTPGRRTANGSLVGVNAGEHANLDTGPKSISTGRDAEMNAPSTGVNLGPKSTSPGMNAALNTSLTGTGTNAASIGRNAGTRTLSDILRKHADKEFAMDQEEASRVGDVLRGWINSSTSPYEAEDEEFSTFVRSKDDPNRGKDDMHVPSATRPKREQGSWGRARGMSESVSALGVGRAE